ncbi:MAG TPA: zinc ribbon domain-containing protein [Candidatus Competibacteraceae bacterium]|nr:zinc ribbon domain-containing protein [Candidatus Competibacteraceae bacterium]MCP5132519.1 zinc ribbon domain-containing protein [Gammaproteobacteria bacterium]HPF57863.1 zinc ribbon domain-containing protein [Candidatus Competibacteraceae bacterium]
MPIYEYRCQSCNHDMEVMQKMSDPELSDCPACGQPQLKKLISAAAFRLKGSGWYETDFKKGSQKNVAKDDASPKESTSAAACDGAGGCGACPAPAAT